ncbi:MAG: phospholipid carrier-dependent glycosyltransferase [Patescibacteria group bacterium]
MKKTNLLYLAIFTILFFLPRVFSLGTDVLNPDGVNWHWRSEQFVVGLKTRDFAKTYQHYHPGVTLTWVVGTTAEIVKRLYLNENVYTSSNYLVIHSAVKYVLVALHFILSLVLIHGLSKIINFKTALLIVALFSLEPFVVGNSRLVHLDMLLTYFLFLSLIYSYIYLYLDKKLIYLLLTSVFLALSFLTKSIGIGVILFVFGYVSLMFIKDKNYKSIVFLVMCTLLTIFVVFPAMWVSPLQTLLNIFNEASRIGIRNGHGQIFFGSYTRDPGILFYPVVLAQRLSVLTLVGVLVYIFTALKTIPKNLQGLVKALMQPSFILYISIFYLGYLCVMVYPSKKIDRYMLPLFPYFALLAVYGYQLLLDRYSRTKYILYIFIGLTFYSLISFFPYYFTFYSPIFINADISETVVGQKPFGIGIPALQKYISTKYGSDVRLGFIDTKPMSALHGNSKVLDIRDYGLSSYDLVVLGINEDFDNTKLKNQQNKLQEIDSYSINGFKFWRIYGKTEDISTNSQ